MAALIAWLVTSAAARTRAARGPREHPRQHHRSRRLELRIHRELDGQDLDLCGGERARTFPLVQHPRRRRRPLGGQCRDPEHLSESTRRADPHPGADRRATHPGIAGFHRRAGDRHPAADHRRPPQRPTAVLCAAGAEFRGAGQGAAGVSWRRRAKARCSARWMRT